MTMLKKIAIHCDLNKTSGLGHLSRMKNLSQELEKKGFKCFFLFHQKDRNYIVRFTKNLKTIFFSGENRINSISHFLTKCIFESYPGLALGMKNKIVFIALTCHGSLSGQSVAIVVLRYFIFFYSRFNSSMI